MKKIFAGLLIILIIAVSIVLIARNTIAKNLIETGIYKLLMQNVSIGKMDIGLLTTDIDVKNIKVDIPQGYKNKLLADIPNLYIDYALFDIISGYMHFPEIRIDIKEANVEKDRNNTLNLDHFKTEEKEEPRKEKKETKFLIDKMILNIDTVSYIDHTKIPPEEKTFKMNFSKTFTNIDNPDQIVSAIKEEIVGQLVSEGINVALKTFEGIINAGEKGGGKVLSSPEKLIEGFFGTNK